MYPGPSLWSFSQIAVSEPDRALVLEEAPSAEALLDVLVEKFAKAVSGGQLRIGMEQAEPDPRDLRVVLQFHFGETESDQFFNATSGYRAQFRQDWHIGLSYNRAIIEALRGKVASMLPSEVFARHLTPKFEDCGSLMLPLEKVLASLDPDLSKVWFCGRLMTGEGRVVQLPSGTVGPRLQLDDQTTWAAIARNDVDAWLDVKGAFVGRDRPYQPKDPVARAKKLQVSGEA